jgi:NAD(P)H-nitrite reductase large subunit
MDQGKTIICRCEEVTLEQLISIAEKYKCSSRELKLRTRAGMGFCGGRTCRHMIDTIVANLTVELLPHEIPLKYQAPVRPISFQILGGEK